MIDQLNRRFKTWARRRWQQVQDTVLRWTKPERTGVVLGALEDVPRGKRDVMLENALLRQQLIVLRRQVKRPALTSWDRLLVVWLSSWVRTWQRRCCSSSPRPFCAGIGSCSSGCGGASPSRQAIGIRCRRR